ncbi:PREDICTED: uncharacterized protein LOC105452908 [Wasmannia auropunctata]|uniref:uncharacterized protein LOC105452908 n=1 Tax=Wasmannia auropunctata TaxID=64793 RepID=UPI0005EF70FD|nr:PREDICTED: uncharacterized protein LOC105452908 [Wasmannia auropunctata]
MERFNLCRKNAEETTELCQKMKDLFATYLSNLPSNFYDITTQALDAFWYIDITFDNDSFMAHTYELHGLTYNKLGWYSWVLTKYRQCIFYLCLVPYIRVPVRAFTNFLILFIF